MDQADATSNAFNSERGENHSPYVTEDSLIVPSDVKFKNAPLEEVKPKKRRRTINEAELMKAQLVNEFNKEALEQRYKQLMHLLKQSKFYSSYLMDKVEDKSKEEKGVRKRHRYPAANDENLPPKKKKNLRAGFENYNIQEYISTEITRQVRGERSKKNLNVNEIKAELSVNLEDAEVDSKAPAESSAAVVPKYFRGELYDYQHKGLDWLKLLNKNALSGILADEMGLGKTIQVIALICHLVEERQSGPYLIVAPLSTIPNWIAEFERFAPDIPVVLFYGTKNEKINIRSKIKRKYRVDGYMMEPVVITTYEVPLLEVKFLQSQNWRYIIVDEGQRIKNYKCKLTKILKSLRSMNRLILTGTPLQNNLTELWSLMNFLMPEIFDHLDTFESWFDIKELQGQAGTEKVLKQEQEKHVISSLREILKPFMLRRTKDAVRLNIPPKKELIVYAPLTELQYDLYKAVLNYDLEVLSKIEQPDFVLPTVNGKRPKRQCVLRKYGHNYESAGNVAENGASNSSSQKTENNIYKQKPMNQKSLQLAKWKHYTDITERNRDFLIHIQIHYRIPMYKRIVNHPYLVHCPLDPTGLPKIDNELIKCSGKLLVLDAMLAKLKVQGHKVLLFSTMTMVLDIIEDYLLLRDYKYVRLDGLTKIEKRKENISAFNNDPNMFLFLISTRAGGVGLNLMGADTVIIYDNDWNPQVDIQAMARCHRIGQTKPIVIYRLCTKGTIDEAILKRAEAKRILEKMVISKNLQTFSEELLLDLKKLLESKEYKIVTSEKEVFTEMELNKLLDRSDLMVNNHNT